MPPKRAVLAAAVLLLTLGILYLPDVGHGFLRDDFAWIRASRVSSLGDLACLFAADNGFYRPLVGLSFALNHAAFGLSPLGYGLTNLGLMLATAAALFGLARASGLPPGTALLATAVWALNPHSIPMAVLWISGRTSLLLTLFCLLAARSVVLDRRYWAALWCLAALLSKEEAVLLPAILFLWAGLAAESLRFGWRRAIARTWPLFLTLVPYALLRARTAAYLPSNAPGYYRLTLSPSRLLRNALEYADRSLTLGVVLLLLLWLISRQRPHLQPKERLWIVQGLILAVGGFGVTFFLPVRSSLYACLPAAGTAIAIAAVAGALWRQVGQAGQRRLLLAGLLLPLLLVPVYRARARRWVAPADVSRIVMAELAQNPAPPGVVTVIHDATGTRASVAGAFGALAQDAVALATGAGTARVWVEPPPPLWESAGLQPPQPGEKVRHFTLSGDGLVPAADQTPF